MRFQSTMLADVFLVLSDDHRDDRGSFARTFDDDLFAEAGLTVDFPQHNLVVNTGRGILRGMHYQTPPHSEVKVVRCVSGVIHDVVVDLRRSSPTFGLWQGFDLDKPTTALFVPEGFAHGYQTLSSVSVVTYLMGSKYQPDAEGGIRFDDPTLAIEWPLPYPILSEKDATLPLFEPEETVFD